MGKTETILIWEQTLYCNAAGKGWTAFPLHQVEDAVGVLQEHFKEGTKFAVLYDPDGMQTEYAECPPGGRTVVREAMATTHEAVSNMHTAWGYQTPVPVPSVPGSASTLCSYETTPVFVLLRRGLAQVRRPIVRAFPLVSLATQMGGTPGRTSIFLVVDRQQAFLYLSTVNGARVCRKLFAGKEPHGFDVWTEISMVFGEYGITFEDGGQRPMLKIYEAPGISIKQECSYWPTLERMAQTEVYSISVFPALLGNLPARHCSSLMEDMPRQLNLTLGFQLAGAVLALVAAGFGAYAFLELSDQTAQIGDLRQTDVNLNAQRTVLLRNKQEMEKLNSLYAQGIFEASRGRFKLVESLPLAVPEEATLESVQLGGEEPHGFRIKGVFWNAGLEDNASARRVSGSNTPATRLSSGLAQQVPGLLVDGARTNFNETTGIFYLLGTTPLPTVEAGSRTEPPKSKPRR